MGEFEKMSDKILKGTALCGVAAFLFSTASKNLSVLAADHWSAIGPSTALVIAVILAFIAIGVFYEAFPMLIQAFFGKSVASSRCSFLIATFFGVVTMRSMIFVFEVHQF